MTERLRERPGGVKDVRGDHEVVTVGAEPLFHRIPLDVEDPILDRPLRAAEPGLGLREEARRDVGVGVIEPSLGQHREDGGGRRSGARSDLDDPQASGRGQPAQHPGDRVGEQPVRGARHRRFKIQVGGGR